MSNVTITKTHEEPTTGPHTGNAFFFAVGGSLWRDTLKVVEKTGYGNRKDRTPNAYIVQAWRSEGWTTFLGHVPADSPEGAVDVALKVMDR